MMFNPKGPLGRRGGLLNGDTMSLTRTVRDRAAAWKLLKWLTDRESGVALGLQTKGSLTLGGRPDVYNDPRILNTPGLPAEASKVRADSMSLKEDVSLTGPYNLRGVDLFKIWDEAINAVVAGKAAANKALLDKLELDVAAVVSLARLTLGS